MNVVAWLASILLGLAFIVAGGSKLAAGPQWPPQARELGAPTIVIPFVPWVEIVVGAATLTRLATPVPAVVALALLVAFTVLIVALLARGRRPACACFGAWSASPIGLRHVLRNLALMVLAVVAIIA